VLVQAQCMACGSVPHCSPQQLCAPPCLPGQPCFSCRPAVCVCVCLTLRAPRQCLGVGWDAGRQLLLRQPGMPCTRAGMRVGRRLVKCGSSRLCSSRHSTWPCVVEVCVSVTVLAPAALCVVVPEACVCLDTPALVSCRAASVSHCQWHCAGGPPALEPPTAGGLAVLVCLGVCGFAGEVRLCVLGASLATALVLGTGQLLYAAVARLAAELCVLDAMLAHCAGLPGAALCGTDSSWVVVVQTCLGSPSRRVNSSV
jgi:hypothetical protein